jgi:tRNA/rRNA methyltransferase
MPELKIKSDHVTIILKKPRYPENIGAAARAMCNMGFSNLVLIDPENPDPDRIKKTATHEASSIVDAIQIVDTTAKAVENCEYVVGTTARLGKQRRKASTPVTLCPNLVDISQNNRIALIFGPEDRGLENSDIEYCDALIHIPTFGFSSLNLAQAVMVVCYELTLTRTAKQHVVPKLAGKKEITEMYSALEKTLEAISYINPEKPEQHLNAFRDFFSRITLRSKEVIILRTLLAKIQIYGNRMYERGLNGNKD